MLLEYILLVITTALFTLRSTDPTELRLSEDASKHFDDNLHCYIVTVYDTLLPRI